MAFCFFVGPSCSGWLCFLCLLGSSQVQHLSEIFKGLASPHLLLVMAYFDLAVFATAIFLALSVLLLSCCGFLC